MNRGDTIFAGELMKTNLEWLVAASGLKNIRCIACSHLLKTKFDSVSVMDNPEGIRWVKQDELVITSGYPLLKSIEEQKKIIRELKEIGCVGLGIKVRGYFKEIPREMIEEASKVGLPLLEIPYYYSLSEVSQIIYNHIFEESYQSRLREQRLIEDISDIFFSKRGVMEMIYRIAEYLKRTIILMDRDFKCIYAAKRMKDKELCTKDDVIKKVYSAEDNRGIFAFSDKTERQAYWVMIPGEEAGSVLLILEDTGNLTTDEQFIVGRCIKILSMGLEQVKAKQENQYEFENAYYKELYEYLNGLRQYDDMKLKSILEEIEVPFEKKRIMLLIQTQTNLSSEVDCKEMIHYCVSKCKEMRGFETCIFYHNNKFIVYLFTDAGKSNPFICHAAKVLADKIAETLHAQVKFRIGISKSSQDITGIKRSYQEAEKAIDIGEKLGLATNVFAYNQLDFYDYLIHYPLRTREQCYDNIRYLLRYDEENNTELTQTLLGFLEYKFNMSETAKALYIHRNTLINRLNKIKELLYNDLETMDDLMPLCIEAYAYKLFS